MKKIRSKLFILTILVILLTCTHLSKAKKTNFKKLSQNAEEIKPILNDVHKQYHSEDDDGDDGEFPPQSSEEPEPTDSEVSPSSSEESIIENSESPNSSENTDCQLPENASNPECINSNEGLNPPLPLDRPTNITILPDYQKLIGYCLDSWYNFYVDILSKFKIQSLIQTSEFESNCMEFDETIRRSGFYCQTLIGDFKKTMDDASWFMVNLNLRDSTEALRRAEKIKTVLPDVCSLESEGLFFPSSPETLNQPGITITEGDNSITIKYNSDALTCGPEDPNCENTNTEDQDGTNTNTDTDIDCDPEDEDCIESEVDLDFGKLFGDALSDILENLDDYIKNLDISDSSDISSSEEISPSDSEVVESSEENIEQPKNSENETDNDIIDSNTIVEGELVKSLECEEDDAFCNFLNSLFQGVDEDEGDDETSEDDDYLSNKDPKNSNSEDKPEQESDDDKTPGIDDPAKPHWSPFGSIVTEKNELIPESEVAMSHDVYKKLVRDYHYSRIHHKTFKRRNYKIKLSLVKNRAYILKKLKEFQPSSRKMLNGKKVHFSKMRFNIGIKKDQVHLIAFARRFRSALILMDIYGSKKNRAKFIQHAFATKNSMQNFPNKN